MHQPPPKRSSSPIDTRRREAAFLRWTATITREGVDDKTLDAIANRAFLSAEVSDDPVLGEMLRTYVGERRAELAAQRRAQESGTPLAPPTISQSSEPDRYQTNLAFDRLLVELETHLRYLDEHGAREVLARLEDMLGRYPQWIDPRKLDIARTDFQNMLQRREHLGKQVDELENRAIRAARSGDHETASAALKKLSAIHATRPSLLPDARLDRIRAALIAASEHEEHRAAARELVARERAVLDEVRGLAAAVHEFHVAAQRLPHDSPEFAAAEKRYRETVRAVKAHDTEWLCDLIVELSDLIEEIHAPHPQADRQLDRFIRTVKHHLHAARDEILAIHRDSQVPPAAGAT